MIAVKVLKLNWTISSILNQINLIEKNFETFVIIKTLYRDRADRKKLWKGKTESKQNSKVKLCLIEKDDITEFINCTLEWETSSQSVWFMLPNLEIGINKLRLVFQEGICTSVWALIPLQLKSSFPLPITYHTTCIKVEISFGPQFEIILHPAFITSLWLIFLQGKS